MKYLILLFALNCNAPTKGDNYYYLNALRVQQQLFDLRTQILIIESHIKKTELTLESFNLIYRPGERYIIYRQLINIDLALASLIMTIEDLEEQLIKIETAVIEMTYAEKVVNIRKLDYDLTRVSRFEYITEFGKKLTMNDNIIKEII